MEQATNLAITISRQLGSGGSYVGQQLAKKIGLFYADREIISTVAKDLQLVEADLESQDEKRTSFWQSTFQAFAAMTPDFSMSPKIMSPTGRELYELESEVIRRIVNERPAVIIGRCGSHVLRDFANHVSIFLHADITFRQNRIQELHNVPAEVAMRMIAQSDRDRSQYTFAFTGSEWTDARKFDMSFDSGRVGLDRIVTLVVDYLKSR